MWANFFARSEEVHGRAGRRNRPEISEGKEGALKLTFFLGLVGLVMMVTAAGTDHWAELAGEARPQNLTCKVAHFGLWRQCLKIIEVQDLEPGGSLCTPVELPGVSNCSYFRFFTTGESTKIMERDAQKDLFIVVAVLAVLCMCLMCLGSLTITMSLKRNPDFLIKLSGTFYICAGLAAVATLLAFDQAVLKLVQSNEILTLEFAYRWSFGCALAAAILSSLAGIFFLLLGLPGPFLAFCRRGKAGTA